MAPPPIAVLVPLLFAVLLASCAAPGAGPLGARTLNGRGRTGPTVPAVPPDLARWLARLPHFPAAPPPRPITLPGGPAAPIYHRLPVDQPVAFLTIDDGFVRDPAGVALLRAAHIRFTMFLIAPLAEQGAGYFRDLVAAGGVVEDHTVHHPELRGRPYPAQRQEICRAAGLLATTFGRTPTLFRPPFGDYDASTLRAVRDCGLHAAFHWSETVNAGVVRYQTAVHRIQPGDILLMHFRTTFLADVVAALTAIHAAGLTPALLEDYVR